MTIVYREPGKIVQDILQAELELEDGQVMFTNQKFEIPTNGLFIVVSYVGPSRLIGNVNEWNGEDQDGLTEIQSATFQHLLQIDMMSYGEDARTRKEEIALALRSIFSEQQQEKWGMQIARQPGVFMDTSFLQDTKMITRYTTTVMTTSLFQKTKAIRDIYVHFERAVPPGIVVNA